MSRILDISCVVNRHLSRPSPPTGILQVYNAQLEQRHRNLFESLAFCHSEISGCKFSPYQTHQAHSHTFNHLRYCLTELHGISFTHIIILNTAVTLEVYALIGWLRFMSVSLWPQAAPPIPI